MSWRPPHAGPGGLSPALLDHNPRARASCNSPREKAGWGAASRGDRAAASRVHRLRQLPRAGGRSERGQGWTVKPTRLCASSIVAHRSIPTPSRAQMESGIIFGSVGALYGEITLKDGRVEQTNFGDYRVLRINEAPQIEVHLIKSAEAPGGIGEPGTSCVMPALTNAVYAATGKRIRKLPVGEQLRSA